MELTEEQMEERGKDLIAEGQARGEAFIDYAMKNTFYLVEATSNEKLHFYFDAIRWGFKVEQCNPGTVINLGKFHDMPVVFGIFWLKIQGKLIGFWDATSQVVDYRMIEEWFDTNMKGVEKTDSSNVHLAYHAVREAVGSDRPMRDVEVCQHCEAFHCKR